MQEWQHERLIPVTEYQATRMWGLRHALGAEAEILHKFALEGKSAFTIFFVSGKSEYQTKVDTDHFLYGVRRIIMSLYMDLWDEGRRDLAEEVIRGRLGSPDGG